MSARNYIIAGAVIVVAGAAALWGSARGQAGQSKQSDTSAEEIPSVQVTTVVSKDLKRELRLAGELKAYQEVTVYPKVESFVDWIGVDRGSFVKKGQTLIRMSAPELASKQTEAAERAEAATSQRSEAEARIQGIKAQRAEAEAKLAADDATYGNLKAAAATPGVVAGNDVVIAEKTVEADRARVKMYQENERAAQSSLEAMSNDEKAAASAARSAKEIASYLHIDAPFDGVITERNVNKGSLAGPAGASSAAPMVRIQQVSTLRLVVYVPEEAVSGVREGETVNFSVPAFPGQTFSAKVARIAHALDPKTRTMPVELDVPNKTMGLAPGMFAEIEWPTQRPEPSLFVPASAVAATTERTFVVRIKENKAEWVDVKQGATMGDTAEVFGKLSAGDVVALRGTDEIRNGSTVNPRAAASTK